MTIPRVSLPRRVWVPRRIMPDCRRDLRRRRRRSKLAKKPVIIAGGGVLYSEATRGLARLRRRARHSGDGDAGGQERACRTAIRSTWARWALPVRRPQLRWRKQADVVMAVGSRLQDFTTGSWALFKNEGVEIVGLNAQLFDASKHRGPAAGGRCHRVGSKRSDAALRGWQR